MLRSKMAGPVSCPAFHRVSLDLTLHSRIPPESRSDSDRRCCWWLPDSTRLVLPAPRLLPGPHDSTIVPPYDITKLTVLQLIQQLDNPLRAAEPFLLAGLLSNYNKFEAANQYWTRFADFVNDEAMRSTVESVGWTSMLLRERYVAIQDDTPAAWSLGGTLSYVGLGSLTRAKPAPVALTEEQQREGFLEQ